MRLLLEEFRFSLKSSLSTQTLRPGVGSRTFLAEGGVQVFCAGVLKPGSWSPTKNKVSACVDVIVACRCCFVVYLRASPQTCLERIKKRNREEESSVPLVRFHSSHPHHYCHSFNVLLWAHWAIWYQKALERSVVSLNNSFGCEISKLSSCVRTMKSHVLWVQPVSHFKSTDRTEVTIILASSPSLTQAIVVTAVSLLVH